MQELTKEDSALDMEISKPTQSAPKQETTMEDQCRSAWVPQMLEKQRCHFVHFLTHKPGTALQRKVLDLCRQRISAITTTPSTKKEPETMMARFSTASACSQMTFQPWLGGVREVQQGAAGHIERGWGIISAKVGLCDPGRN
jgi:hypothetical protein